MQPIPSVGSAKREEISNRCQARENMQPVPIAEEKVNRCHSRENAQLVPSALKHESSAGKCRRSDEGFLIG